MRLLLVLAGAVAVLVSGCGEDVPSGGQAPPTLAGTTWELATAGGEAVPVAGASWITFTDDGSVNGSGACNGFSGSYEEVGDGLTIGPLAATLRLCTDTDLDEQEQTFFAALEATTGFTVDADGLALEGEGGEIATLVTVERRDGVAGAWSVTSFDDGAGAVVPVLDGTELTAELTEDGMVGGSSGCNTYTGGYTVDGDAVSIGPLSLTRKACADPEGVMDQEVRFVAALESVATWSIRSNTLELRTSEDAIAVTMTVGP